MCGKETCYKGRNPLEKGRLTTKEDTPPKTPPRYVEVVRSDYQPSKAELEEDMHIDAPFEELVQTVVEPVTVAVIPRPRPRPKTD